MIPISTINEVKTQILDILSSNGYNTSNPNIQNALDTLLEADSDEDTFSVNQINVRILSKDELEKYLINSTLNGSITKYNDAVWNFAITPSHSIYCAFGMYRRGNDNVVNPMTSAGWNIMKNKNSIIAKYPEYGNSLCNGNVSKENTTSYEYTINVIANCLQDNINSNICTYSYPAKQLLLGINIIGDFWVKNITNMEFKYYEYQQKSFLTNCTKKETIAKLKDTYTLTYNWTASSSSNHAKHQQSTTVKFDYLSSFRPVFQYKDNNKSSNIHY